MVNDNKKPASSPGNSATHAKKCLLFARPSLVVLVKEDEVGLMFNSLHTRSLVFSEIFVKCYTLS